MHKAFLTPCVVDLEEYTKVLQTLPRIPHGELLACAKGVPLNPNLVQHDSIKAKLKLQGNDNLLKEESYTVSQSMDTVYFASTWGASLAHSLVLKDTKDYCRIVLDAISFDVIGTSHKNLTFISNLERMGLLSDGRKLVPFDTGWDLKRLSVNNMHDSKLYTFRN